MNPLHHSLVAKLGGPAISAAVHLSVFAAIAGGGAASARGPARDSIEAMALFEAPPVEPAPPAAPPAPAPADAPVRPHAAAAPHPAGAHHTHTYPAPPGHDDVPHSPELAHTHDAPAATAAAASGAPTAAAKGDPPAPTSPRFTLKLGTTAASLPSAPGAAGAGSARGAGGSGEGAAGSPEAAVAESQVSSPARVVAASPPAYPPAARAAQVEADVGLELVVDASGRVAEARVVRPAGYGFSESALAAVRAYRFSPALRAGAPVRVRMRWTVQFRLD